VVNFTLSKSMLRYLLIITVSLFAVLFTAANLNAQDAPQEPDRTLLPDIDPQDIEIRSQFEARFPGLRRQPILGFNPEPRVFQVDPDRRPFIEDEEAVAASVPVGQLDRPDPPEYRALTYADPQNGFARGGIGTFITPEADVYAIAGLGRGQWVSANVNYRSTDGHLDEQRSAFRDFNTNVRSQHRLSDRSVMKLNVNAFSDFNYLPISRTEDDIMSGDQGRTSSNGVRFDVDFTNARNSIAGLNIKAGGYFNQFDAAGSSTNVAGSPMEWGSSTTIDYTRAGSNIDEVYGVVVDVDLGGIETIGSGSNFWNITKAGVSYDRLYNYRTDVSATLGGAYVTDALDSSSFYIAPKVDVVHTLFDGLDLRGMISGTPEHRSLKNLQDRNRFIDLEDPLSHQYNARALAEVIVEPLSGTSFTGGVSYQHSQNYAVFNNEKADGAGNPLFGAYGVSYQDASFMKAYGSFSQQLVPDRLWADVGGFWQRPRLSDGDKIPFVEALGVRGAISWRPIGQLLIEGWGDFTGSRFNPNGDDLSSYFLMGTKFEISLGERTGIYGKLLNVTDQQYEVWDGYRERGFQGFVGITYLF